MKNLDSVNQILRYLKSKPGKGLLYSKYNNLNIVVFKIQIGQVARILEDPPTGYCTLGGNFVTWNSKKRVVA